MLKLRCIAALVVWRDLDYFLSLGRYITIPLPAHRHTSWPRTTSDVNKATTSMTKVKAMTFKAKATIPKAKAKTKNVRKYHSNHLIKV